MEAYEVECARNVRQRTNLGACRPPWRAFVTRAGGGASILAAAAVLSLCTALSMAEAPGGGEASPDSFLARGIAHFSGSDMRRGLEELRTAAEMRPGHHLTRMSFGRALLAAGLFAEAEGEYRAALGEEQADALASGRLSPAGLPSSTDTEAILGLATAVHLQGGRTREAERLYRVHAEAVGPLSREAARSYVRLHELGTESNAEWIDAEAELAKANAVDPEVRLVQLLPSFVDPRTLPELEPYLRPVVLSRSRADTAVDYASVPVLSRWVAPSDTTEVSAAVLEGMLQLEILVGADGVPQEAHPVPAARDHDLEPLLSTVRQWWFTPASADGEQVPAWVLFGELSRDEWSVVSEGEEEAAEEEEEEGEGEGEEGTGAVPLETPPGSR